MHHLVVLHRQVVPRPLEVRHLPPCDIHFMPQNDFAWTFCPVHLLPRRSLAALCLPQICLPDTKVSSNSNEKNMRPLVSAIKTNETRQGVACLHEVAGRDGLADVGVVVARLEVCAHQRRAQPGCYPHLRRHMHASFIKPQPFSDAHCLFKQHDSHHSALQHACSNARVCKRFASQR